MDGNEKPTCACGCGKERSTGAQYLPGHDRCLEAALAQTVGGLLPLKALVEANSAYAAGMISTEQFTMTVRKIFANNPKQTR